LVFKQTNNVFTSFPVHYLLTFKTINSLLCLILSTLNFKRMKTEDQNKKAKGPGNEDYDVNHPQNITKPSFRSDSEHRNSGDKPATENLNSQLDENGQLISGNDDNLHGNTPKTDLGNGQERDDKEDEKLIRE
jgi:hypothetical protein